MARKAEPVEEQAPEEEAPYVFSDHIDFTDFPRNEFGTMLNPVDGQPVFNTITGESRHQYLARKFEEDKAALLAELAAGIEADTTADQATPTPQQED